MRTRLQFFAWQFSMLYILCNLSAPALGATTWQQDAQSGRVFQQRGDSVSAGRYYISALGKLRSTRTRESDPTYRQLFFGYITDDILDLGFQRRAEDAENLAKWKVATAEGLFGANSVSAVDAWHDLCTIYKVERKSDLQVTAEETMQQRMAETIKLHPAAKDELAQLIASKNKRSMAKLRSALGR